MKPTITRFNDKTGDFEITIPVPFTLKDGIEYADMIVVDIPKYEDTKDYNVFDLIRENQELKKQLEYLRSGEYINQLKFERNMLEDVVNKGEVSKEDKEFIDMTHRNTELLEQQKEFIEWLESMLVSELDVFTEVKICDVLSKYKEIIGKDINVGTKEAKNDN